MWLWDRSAKPTFNKYKIYFCIDKLSFSSWITFVSGSRLSDTFCDYRGVREVFYDNWNVPGSYSYLCYEVYKIFVKIIFAWTFNGFMQIARSKIKENIAQENYQSCEAFCLAMKAGFKNHDCNMCLHFYTLLLFERWNEFGGNMNMNYNETPFLMSVSNIMPNPRRHFDVFGENNMTFFSDSFSYELLVMSIYSLIRIEVIYVPQRFIHVYWLKNVIISLCVFYLLAFLKFNPDHTIWESVKVFSHNARPSFNKNIQLFIYRNVQTYCMPWK